MAQSHEIAIQFLEEELELTIAIINYFNVSKNRLAAQGFTVYDPAYRHWALNQIRMQKRRVNLEHTIKFLKKVEGID